MSTQTAERIPEWTLGDRLRKAREMSGYGIRDFALQLGVSHQTITNAEKGHRTVKRATIMAWSLATRVPLAWLENGETPAGPEGPDGGEAVRHQGLEPRTYWFRAFDSDQQVHAPVLPLRRAA